MDRECINIIREGLFSRSAMKSWEPRDMIGAGNV